VNTHPHSDHTGGCRARAEAPPSSRRRTTSVPRQSAQHAADAAERHARQESRKAKIEAVAEKKVYSDGTQTVELYHIPPAPHSNGLLIAFLPKEKSLLQGDFTLPRRPAANDHVKALFPVLEKLNLDFDRYIPVHTVPTPQTKPSCGRRWVSRSLERFVLVRRGRPWYFSRGRCHGGLLTGSAQASLASLG
jgi:glyoxylase-like metal-dependent hydrolase (beta-lactamase superfamily II)